MSPQKRTELVWETELIAIPRRPTSSETCFDTNAGMLVPTEEWDAVQEIDLVLKSGGWSG